MQAILTTLTSAAILYLLASIAVSVFSNRTVRLRGNPIHADNVDEIIQCQEGVERLFQELNDRTFRLYALVGRQEVDLAQKWQSFSRAWHNEWLELGQRCRFVELRDRGDGAAFDRLAYAHAALEEIELKFAALLRNYIEQQLPRLDEIRHDLEASRRGLEALKKKQAAPARRADSGLAPR